MLKIAIENSYVNNYKWKDEFWSRKFMQEVFQKNNIELVRVSMNKMNKKISLQNIIFWLKIRNIR